MIAPTTKGGLGITYITSQFAVIKCTLIKRLISDVDAKWKYLVYTQLPCREPFFVGMYIKIFFQI